MPVTPGSVPSPHLPGSATVTVTKWGFPKIGYPNKVPLKQTWADLGLQGRSSRQKRAPGPKSQNFAADVGLGFRGTLCLEDLSKSPERQTPETRKPKR